MYTIPPITPILLNQCKSSNFIFFIHITHVVLIVLGIHSQHMLISLNTPPYKLLYYYSAHHDI